MMEHMALAAMEAETEFEAAEHFLPLVPLVASKILPLAARAAPRIAAKVLPRIAKAVSHVTPHLTRGVTHITRALHRNPNTRHLVRVIPSVARRAVATIARHAAAGHPVTPRHAARILRHAHQRVLHNPHIVNSVLRHANRMNHRYHRLGGLPVPVRGAAAHLVAPHLRGVARHLRGVAPHLRGVAGLAHYPAAGARAYAAPHLARLHAARGHICPTCGGHTMRGTRRICCCC